MFKISRYIRELIFFCLIPFLTNQQLDKLSEKIINGQ